STALTAPALEPLTASKPISGSSSRRSSTPQVKAPNEPPPWSARESVFGGHEPGARADRLPWASLRKSRARLMTVMRRNPLLAGEAFLPHLGFEMRRFYVAAQHLAEA